MAYIRFVINDIDPDSGRRQGLFQIASRLRRGNAFDYVEEQEHDDLLNWFNKNLEKPESFSISKRSSAKKVALSWFKPTATEHIRQMHRFKALLESHGITVEIIKTERPGYVVYQDAFQIAAEPFFDTPT